MSMKRYAVDSLRRYTGGGDSWRNGQAHARHTPASVLRSSKSKLIAVPSIVVHEDELSGLSVPRPALPSLDLTQMRREGGTGYSPTSPVFPGQLSIQLSPVQDDDIVERSSTELRSWSSIVGPDSHLTPSDGQLYTFLIEFSDNRSQPLDEEEASQVARSLGESVWSDAIRGGSSHSRTPSR